MGTTVGGEQEAPPARYLSAGDDEAPSVGPPHGACGACKRGSRPRVVPAPPQSQAHLPPVRLSERTRQVERRTRRPPLGCVYT